MHWVPGQSKVSIGIWVRPDCSSWRTSWENRGDCGLLCRKDNGSKALGSEYSAVCLSLEVAILGKYGPTYQHSEVPGQTAIQVGSQLHPSVNRLPKDPLGTQLPLISSRDKAPPTRGIGVSSTYQWAGISPSHQEAYSKPLYQLQPQGGQTPEVRETTTLLSAKRRPHQKPIKMKRQRTVTQIREQEKTPENQLSDQEIFSLQEKDFRLLMLKMVQDIGNKLEAKMDNL